MKKTLLYICMICACLATSVQAQTLVGNALSQISTGGLIASTKRHHSNQILDYVSRCAVTVQVKGDGYVIKDGVCGDFGELGEAPNNLDKNKFIIRDAGKGKATFTITSPVIEDDALRSALTARDNTFVTIEERKDKKIDFIVKK